jgi:hypothetical protein
MLKLMMAGGVVFWVVIAVWFVRLGLGLDHLSRDQIAPGIVGGICGGWAAWYFVPRLTKKEAAQPEEQDVEHTEG